MALFVAALGLLDVLSGSVHSPGSLMAWWSSGYWGAPGRALSILGLSGVLLAYAWAPRMGWLRRRATQGVLGLMLAFCLLDSFRVLALHRSGAVHNARAVPLSVLLALAVFGMLYAVAHSPMQAQLGGARRSPLLWPRGKSAWRAVVLRWLVPPAAGEVCTPADGEAGTPRSSWRDSSLWREMSRAVLGASVRNVVLRVPVLLGAGLCAVAFAYGQMVCFGNSDYRRQADAVVVFGARVYRSGRPSLALADRVRTGAALVRNGYAPVLVVSGGPGDGATHEVEAMRALAIAEGVPPSAIVMDRGGVNTRETVRNTARLLEQQRAARVLAVSHGYHLPRIKLSYQQHGMRAFTVPAKETRTLIRLPWYMARESLAFWAHAFRVA